MLERLKNLIYDCSDFLLALLIIVIMVGTITWKLSDIITVPLAHDSSSSIVENEADDSIIVEENSGDYSSEEYPNTEENVNQPLDQDPQIDNVSDNEVSDNAVIEIDPVESSNSKDIVVDIPKGTAGTGIAKILQEKGLIDSSSDFINRVEELELAPKLRFGEFTIKSNSSIDDIIYIITGVKR